jgi:hypothetical protein
MCVSGTHETIETKRLVFEVSLLRNLIRLQGFRVRTHIGARYGNHPDLSTGVWKHHYP